MNKRWQAKESSGIVRVSRCAARLCLAAMMGLVALNVSPATAKADTNPVDLVLDGEGASSWRISNLKPTDNGSKVVTLRNAGSRDGFVTIWLSDVVSNEGLNPEAETGDTAEPGELDDYLLLNISSNRSRTTLNLPATVNNLPRSISDPKSIEIVPLKVGDTVSVQWQWELPAETGNVVQGDNISFTINYLLREAEITDVSNAVAANGTFTEDVTAAPAASKGKIAIKKDTVAKTKDNQPLSEVWLIDIGKESAAIPGNKVTGSRQYEVGPHGTTFDKPVTITLGYDPDDIPQGGSEEGVAIATWLEDSGQWSEVKGSTVDLVNRTVSAPVNHFSRYTIVVPVPPPPPPSPPPSSVGIIPPSRPVVRKQPPPPVEVAKRTVAVVETDMLGDERKVEIEADGTLLQPLKLSDGASQFVIEADSGSRITDSAGRPLTRLKLTLLAEPIAVPENMVILSPTYELIGYIGGQESSGIIFDPPARLTISYDPRKLSEDTFLPFIVNYTDEQGLVRLEPPPDSVVEVGKAVAEISRASLFAVAAELVPPPPPLPAMFEMSNLVIDPGQPGAGQPILISLTVANEGATAGTLELHLIIDGIVRVVREVSLAGNSHQTLTFEISGLAAGKHRVKIGGLTKQFRVVSVTTLPGELEVNWLVLDLGVAVALLVGAFVLYWHSRRWRQVGSSGVEAVLPGLEHYRRRPR